jgi:hypothetical protein
MNNVRVRVRALQEEKANNPTATSQEESFAQAVYDIYNDVKPERSP